MRWIIIFSILLCSVSAVFAQDKEVYDKGLVQLSGIVSDIDSNTLVPYVTLQNMRSQKKDLANYQGYFSLVVNEGDTIQFSSIGYDTYQIVVPKDIVDHKFTVKIGMHANVVDLPVLHVFPWATIEQFNRDFLTMKFTDDALELARKNIDKQSIFYLSRVTPPDAGVTRVNTYNSYHDQMGQKNMKPVNTLLSPIAWAKFISQITSSDKKKSN